MTYKGMALPLLPDQSEVIVRPQTDDLLISFGNRADPTETQLSVDLRWMGEVRDAFLYADASASLLELNGPMRLSGFNRQSTRYELKWVAGQRGKPSLNADIQNANEGVRMIADPDFEVLGTNMTSALSTFHTSGGITLTTAGANNDQAILLPHLDANQSSWNLTLWALRRGVCWEAVFQTGALVTTCILWAGLKLTNTPVIATDNDQIFLRYQSGVNGGRWQVVYSIGGVDTEVDTGVAVAINTVYHIMVEVTDMIARVYLDGVLMATTGAVDNVSLIPYIGVQATAVAARNVRVLGQSISRLAQV
jgi:hypothetical protein